MPAAALAVLLVRVRSRRRRRYVRLGVVPYRTDRGSPDAVVAMFESLQRRVAVPGWRRILFGQPSIALELHVLPTAPRGCQARLAVCCPDDLVAVVQATLRAAYPNLRLQVWAAAPGDDLALVRLRKRERFTIPLRPVGSAAESDRGAEPLADRLLRVMAAAAMRSVVQVAATPAPLVLERWTRSRVRGADWRAAHRERPAGEPVMGLGDDSEEQPYGLSWVSGPLFFGDLRVLAPDRMACAHIASELRTAGQVNPLVQRGAGLRRWRRVRRRRVERGEGNLIPGVRRGVYAASELAVLWQLPSVGFTAVPLERASVPVVPAPPAIRRPGSGSGLLEDEFGAVTLHEQVRWQNVAVSGAVGLGKTSFVVASIREDLGRPRCAVIVLDPKGDAADAALSAVPEGRTCTLLNLAQPTCGFNPLAVQAPPDAIADSVVAAIRHLFSDSDIRASSDRYLRNAIVAVLAHDRGATLWDAARLLAVTEEGTAFRRHVGMRLHGLVEYREIADFFGDELPAQLADARSTTTAKLDAPANKLARLLNAPAIKRVLLNRALTIDFERIIARAEVLVVRGALGEMGAGNTAVVMQLLTGMLDAGLARQQDLVPEPERVTVALKIDEAPLVINRGFAQTLALKRSAGLETVACWQSDAQWEEPAVREQLDALFAHRVYFATSSAREARATASLMMAEYSDQLRAGVSAVTTLGQPDVRLYLPRHVAVVSWNTPAGRQPPFIARTLAMEVDPGRLEHHARAQQARGGRRQEDLSQPHWESGEGLPRPVFGRIQTGAAVGDTGREGGPGDTGREGGPGDTAGREGGPGDTGREGGPSDTAGRENGPAAGSRRELVALDDARASTWEVPAAPKRAVGLERGDRAVLAWIAELGCALSTQVHRRFHQGRAPSTTQRQLKRCWDAGWLTRLRFHGPDGRAVPMCYAATEQARRWLRDGSAGGRRLDHPTAGGAEDPVGITTPRAARRALHVTGWLIELEHSLGETVVGVRGRGRSLLRPRPAGGQRLAAAQADVLRLPGGRRPHGFLHTLADGRRAEVEEFHPVNPDATVTLALEHDGGQSPIDLLVCLHPVVDRLRSRLELERYDHLIAGWCLQLRRYRELGPPLAIFVCRDDEAALALCQLADEVVTACWSYAGQRPSQWIYVTRQRMLFAAEGDIHAGRTSAYALDALPPGIRSGGEEAASRREIIAPELLQSPPASAQSGPALLQSPPEAG